MNAHDLPTTELLPVTADSHPFNGAAWQNKPINLARYGYVEREYLLSSESNVYDWTPNGNFEPTVLRSGDVTTRMLVRRPKNMKTWSGKVNVEIINMSAGYDWTAVWSALWERTLGDHDIYVGITGKPNVLPGMQQLDPERYADLSWDESAACRRADLRNAARGRRLRPEQVEALRERPGVGPPDPDRSAAEERVP